MLTDEDRKQLEIFRKKVEKEQEEYEQVNEYTKFLYNNRKFILNLIKKQQEEIEENTEQLDLTARVQQNYKNAFYKRSEENAKLRNEIAKKDKIIDEMAGYLAIIRDCPNEDKGANIDCENRCSIDDDIYAECWKRYFEGMEDNE